MLCKINSLICPLILTSFKVFRALPEKQQYQPPASESSAKRELRRRVRSSQGVAVAAHVRRRDGNLYFDGGKREGERRERESVVTRHKK